MSKRLRVLTALLVIATLTSCANNRSQSYEPRLTAEEAKAIAIAALTKSGDIKGLLFEEAKYQARFRSWWVTFSPDQPTLDADILVVVRDKSRRVCIQAAEIVNGPCI
jgi:hypothetical protein